MLSLIMVAVRGLSVVTNNPALGGGSSVRLQEVSELLNLLGDLIQAGDEGHQELKAFANQIESMAKEGRAPSRAEWEALRGRSDEAHEALQEAKAELEGPQTSTREKLETELEDLHEKLDEGAGELTAEEEDRVEEISNLLQDMD